MNRREFLRSASAAGLFGTAALGLGACSSTSSTNATGSNGTTPGTNATPGTQPLPDPKTAPFDTVVVAMMENRSFDHLLGWLPGANGKQAGLSYVDQQGQSHPTWPLAPNWTGCEFQDPLHLWQAMQTHWDNGACDGFLKTQPNGDLFPIGYYGPKDLPITAALAQGYTCFDNYFASMLGPTWPNRLYQLCAQTDIDFTGFFPEPGGPYPTQLDTAIFDIVQAAGLTTGYYTYGEPMTGLFASQRYNKITYPIDQFWTDAKAGKLPNVTFVDPDYTAAAELTGTSNDYHAYGSVQAGEAFVAQVHDALTTSPQWPRMVAMVNFDESGGFFDHVSPPAVQDASVLNSNPANGAAPGPNLKMLGFRVPATLISPFAPQKVDQTGPYEHCSILKMIEWRWGLKPMTIRDQTANNIANALDFSKRRDPITLPAFTPAASEKCTNPNHLP